MHGPDDPDAKRKPKPNSVSASEYRERRKKDVPIFPGRIGPGAVNAMAARHRYLGKSREEAERLARDPDEISKLVFDVMESIWARDWFELMKKLRRSS